MKFMVTSRKGAAAAVAFLLATPVVALTGIGGGVAQAGVVYGPTQSIIPGSLFLGDAAATTNATTNNTLTDTFSISLNPASPNVGQVTTVSFSGTSGPLTGPVDIQPNGQIVRVKMEISGTNSGIIDLASGSSCNYPVAFTARNGNPLGPYTATGTFTPTSTGATSIALKQIMFDDQGDGFNFGPTLCQGTSVNANYYASAVTQTAGSGLAGLTKTAPVASSTIKATANVVAPTAPGKPSAPTALAGDTEATVSWSAASDTGGSAITGYTVTAVEDATKTCTPTPATGLTCTVAGLTNDTPYTFTLVASNAIGDSTASNASNAVTPKAPTAPVAPSAPTAVAGDAQATVTWTAPSDNGGSAVTGYTVTAVEDATKTCTPTPATALTCTVTGLTNDTAYTFTVVATNAIGSSSASAPSIAVTPEAPTAPGKPSAPAASAGNAEATITWDAASDNGGSAITGYTVTTVEDPTKTCTPSPATALTCTVTGLTNGTPYTFTLVASNVVGPSVASDPSNSATPATVTEPGKPAAPTAVAGDASATVTWVAATDDGGSAITGYTITAVEDATKSCTPTPATALTCTVTGLTNGTDYTFTLVATNAIGDSVDSDPSTAVTPEGAGPTQDIPSTVTQQVAGVKCQNGIQGVSNWTDGDTSGFASPAGSGADSISDPTFTVALTPAAPTAGQKVTIAVTFDKGITNGPSKQDEGKTRPSARVIVTGALSATIIVNGTPYGTAANPVLPGNRFPGQTMTKANAFTFPADASATNPVFVELQTIAFDTRSLQPDFNWPNGPADTFLTVCNKSAAPLTATSLTSPTKKIKAQAAIVPIGVTAAVPFEGEVTPPPTIPPVDDNGGGDGTDTSGGTLPNTGGNPISSLWVALILFQIGLIMAVRSVRAAPVKTARHL
jgi:hypothetical protein